MTDPDEWPTGEPEQTDNRPRNADGYQDDLPQFPGSVWP